MKRILLFVLLTTPFFTLKSQVKIVEWGGQMVTADASLPVPSIITVNINGDTITDRETRTAFNEVIPLNITGGSYKSFEIPLHFAFLGYSLNSGGGFDTWSITNSGNSDYLNMRYQESTPATLHALFFFKKTDFLTTGSSKIYLDSTSSFSRSFTNFEHLDTARFILKDNGQYYISESIGSSLTFATGASDGNWALYNPADTLDFFDDTAAFLPRNFTDITAVGVLVDDDNWYTGRRWIHLSQINVTARMSIEPTLTSPAAGVYLSGDTIDLAATVNSVNPVTTVKFYDNSTLIGTDNIAPYELSWLPAAIGKRNVYVVAYDNLGDSVRSAVVKVDIRDVKIIAPLSGAVYSEGDTVTVTALNVVPGPGLKLYLYTGSTLRDSLTAAPFTFKWQVTQYGTYNIYIKAVNDVPSVSISDTVSITVNNVPPTVSLTFPVNNDKFPLGDTVIATATAVAPYGTITRVEFNNGSVSYYDNTSPYSYAFYYATTGNYRVRARSRDDANVDSPYSGYANYSMVVFTATVAPATTQVINLSSGTTGSLLTASTNITYTGDVTYRWLWGTDSAVYINEIAGQTASTYMPDFSTVDTLWVVCEATKGTHVDTSNAVKIRVVNITGITPVIDGSSVVVYPNPTNGAISIDGSDISMLEVFDLSGHKLLSFSRNTNYFDLSSLSPGSYLIRIHKGLQTIKKMIVIQ